MNIINAYFVIEDEIDGEEILKRIEKAGRTCYKSEDKITVDSAKEFVKRIIKSGHHSVLEHEKITVRIVCDRGVTHEIVRHRIASYSQESTRYCNYSKGKFGGEITVIDPVFWDHEFKHLNIQFLQNPRLCSEETLKLNAKYNVWKEAMEAAESYYLKLLELGASAQEARSVLPNSLKADIVMTANLREWRHFFTIRTTDACHPQMREISRPMLKEFQKLIPVIFDDIAYKE